jgi:hypothetical protein
VAFGRLTDGQLAAITKCVACDAEREAAAQARIDNAATVGVSKIEQAFATCRQKAQEAAAVRS